MKIENRTENIRATDCDVYKMVSDCRSLERMMPEQVKDWRVSEDHCEFTIAGIASVQIDVVEKEEFSTVVYRLSNDKNIPVMMSFLIEGMGGFCNLTVSIDAEVPLFLQSVIKNPLQKVANSIGEKIKSHFENQ